MYYMWWCETGKKPKLCADARPGRKPNLCADVVIDSVRYKQCPIGAVRSLMRQRERFCLGTGAHTQTAEDTCAASHHVGRNAQIMTD